MSDKSGWEGRSQPFRDSRWGRQGSVPSPWTQPKKNRAREPLEGCIVWGSWGLKGKFPTNQVRFWTEGVNNYPKGFHGQ